jgi:hypothetical protein
MDHVRNLRLIDDHNHMYGLSDGPFRLYFIDS